VKIIKEDTLFTRHVKGIDIFCHNLLVQIYYSLDVSIAVKMKYTVTIKRFPLFHSK
jgi:hypothetical protein